MPGTGLERIAVLEARVGMLERRLARVRQEVEQVIRADDIAQAVADEMDSRREQSHRNISGLWMKAGIVALCISIPASLATFVAQVIG